MGRCHIPVYLVPVAQEERLTQTREDLKWKTDRGGKGRYAMCIWYLLCRREKLTD